MPQVAAPAFLAGVGAAATFSTVGTIVFAVGSTLLLGLMARSAHTPINRLHPLDPQSARQNTHTGGSIRTQGPGAARVVFGRRRIQVAPSFFGDNDSTLRMGVALSLGEVESIADIFSPSHDALIPTSRGLLSGDAWLGGTIDAPTLPPGSSIVRVFSFQSVFEGPDDLLSRIGTTDEEAAVGDDTSLALPGDDEETTPEEEAARDIQDTQRTDYTRSQSQPEESVGNIGLTAGEGTVADNNQSSQAPPGAISLSDTVASTGSRSNAAVSNDDSVTGVGISSTAPSNQAAFSTASSISESRTDAAPIGESGPAAAAGHTALPGLTVPSAPSLPSAPNVVDSIATAVSQLPPEALASPLPGVNAVGNVITTSLSNLQNTLGGPVDARGVDSDLAVAVAASAGLALAAGAGAVALGLAAPAVGLAVGAGVAAGAIVHSFTDGPDDTSAPPGGGGYIQARPGDVIVTRIGNTNVEELAQRLAEESIARDRALGVLPSLPPEQEDDEESDPDDSGGVPGIDHGGVDPGSGDDDFGGEGEAVE